MSSEVAKRLQYVSRLSNAFVAASVYDDDAVLLRANLTCRLHTRCITAIKVSSGDNPFVVSAGLDCTLIISDYNSGRVIKSIDTDQSFVFDISILQSGHVNVFATASQDGKVRVYDISNNFECMWTVKQKSEGVCQIIWSVALYCDARGVSYCLSSGATKTIHVYNLETMVEVLTLNGHKEGVRCLAVSNEGMIASGSNDHSVKLWSLPRKRFVQTLRGHAAEVNAVVFIPNSNYLISACENNIFRQWDYINGDRIRVYSAYSGASILSLAVVPHPTCPLVLVAGTVSEQSLAPLVPVEVWDITSGKIRARCTGTRYQISGVDVAYHPKNGKCYIVGGGLDSTVRMWTLDMNTVLPAECLNVSSSRIEDVCV
mmetsp:Transcript_7740/g.11491  ORF Transcript_7740/g.11491 Transcript_7740/m.11491 type:complete len:372 (-) Transcript_7740:157-1272(-)